MFLEQLQNSAEQSRGLGEDSRGLGEDPVTEVFEMKQRHPGMPNESVVDPTCCSERKTSPFEANKSLVPKIEP